MANYQAKVTNALLLGISGAANIGVGCMMVWFSKMPESGAHVTGIIGMLLVVWGWLQKLISVAYLLDARRGGE